jgi:thioesterase domain-containing protein
LSRFLGQQQPFYGIQAKGLDGRAELLTTVEVMADYYVKEIVKMQPDGPYYLGGYCLGGQIAYEMARNLLKMGKRVAFVALLDTQRRWNAEEGFKLKLLHRYQQIAFHLRNFLLADYKGKAAFVRDKMIELSRRIKRRLLVFMSITAFELKLRSERPLVVMEHVNDRAANNYVALPYDGTITLFCPKGNYAGYEDPLMGWGDGLTRGVDVHRLSVYPAGMLIDPFVGELAEIMRNCLEEAQQKKDKTQRRYSRNMH